MSEVLIETTDLKKYFKTSSGMLHAVDGVNLRISQGKTLGIVGESGCGKSTLGRTMLRVLEATSGAIYYKGEDITKLSPKAFAPYKRQMQMIFQDPYASLDPRMTVSQLIAEPFIVNAAVPKREIPDRVMAIMEQVGLDLRLMNTYPHEMDGGRRQRVGVARALALGPEFIVCDEPVSALDVSIQAQIINLLMDLQEERGLTYAFITHDLSVVKHISDEIAVMYLGQCVERGPTKELFANPRHPYTQALLEAIPIPDISRKGRRKKLLQGEVTSPINPEPGCRFAARCEHVSDRCRGRDIKLQEDNAAKTAVACVLYE